MTRIEAIEQLNMILDEITESEDAVCYVTDCFEDAIRMAITDMRLVEGFANASPWRDK
jgi:hypothetical protein